MYIGAVCTAFGPLNVGTETKALEVMKTVLEVARTVSGCAARSSGFSRAQLGGMFAVRGV